MPSLRELKAEFLRYEERDGHIYHVPVKALAEAMGVEFLCPKCFAENGGSVGTHIVICWSANRGTPAHASPLPGRWSLDGSGIDDLTLNGENGKSRSVLLMGGCGWHGFVTNGAAD